MKNTSRPHVNLDKLNKLVALAAAIFLLLQLFLPIAVSAAAIAGRKFTLGSSQISASTTYTFASNALPTTGTPVKSVKGEACTTASGSCTTPTGFSAASADISGQPSGLGAASAWSDASDAGNLKITHATNSTNPSGAVSIPWTTVTNPSTTNTTYYLKVTTYSDSAYTTAIDTGTVAVSTANQISVTASVDETLSFCIYTGANCAAGGATVALGTLSASSHAASNFGTNKMEAATNANSGYVITYTGSTLTRPDQTIPANSGSTQVAGTEEFGLNLKNNADPDVGVEASGGSGAAAAGYGTADSFKFNSTDTVASAASSTVTTTYTVSYVADISTITKPGAYSTTVTYVATATF
ncbi:TPA: hypothetical protein DIS56_03275 [Candidatus Saccharibacteria bacterium]|nr:hypothetical protein [Candidatus Saccharibacteria bacterium]